MNLRWVRHSGVYHATGTRLTIRPGDKGKGWELRDKDEWIGTFGTVREAKAAAVERLSEGH